MSTMHMVHFDIFTAWEFLCWHSWAANRWMARNKITSSNNTDSQTVCTVGIYWNFTIPWTNSTKVSYLTRTQDKWFFPLWGREKWNFTFSIVDITVYITELNMAIVAATLGHSLAFSRLLWFHIEPRHWCASSFINNSCKYKPKMWKDYSCK